MMPRNLFLLLAIAAAAQSASLVLIDGDATGYTEGWREQLQPVYCASEFTLGVTDSPVILSCLKVTVLDAGFTDLDDYRLVFLSPGAGPANAAVLGEVILDREGIAVVRSEEGFPEICAAPGIRFVQPLRYQAAPREIPIPASSGGLDDSISDIVAAVSQTYLQSNTQSLQDYQTRYSSTDSYDTACDWVQTKFEEYGLAATQQTFTLGSYNCQNVIAELPGTVDSTVIWIICGHLDSTSPSQYTFAPGADDNASGSSAVVEAARILSGYDFNYTIRFICFGGEEQGLYGSSYYASQAASASENIVGVVNLDMIYYGPSGYEVLWVPYNTGSTGLALALEAISDTYVPALTVNVEYSPGTTYSDHSSFWNEGYAAVLGIEQEVFSNPYYHQTSDILSNYLIYFPFGTNCAKAAIATVAYLAEPISTGIEGSHSGVAPSALSMSISPNPVQGSATIVLSRRLETGAVVRVFDLAGRTMESLEISGEEGAALTVDVSGLPAGAYVARAIEGDGITASAMLLKL
jgi:hypothetical protein